MGSVGAAMRSVGGTMEQRERSDQAQARQASNPNGNRPSGSGGGGESGGNPSGRGTGPRNPNSPTGGTPASRAPSSPRPASPSGGSSSQSSPAVSGSGATPSNQLADDPNNRIPSGRGPASSSPGSSAPNSSPPTSSTRNPADANFSPPGSGVLSSASTPGEDRTPSSNPGAMRASLPPPQTPSVTPMGTPFASSSSPTGVPLSAPPSASQPAPLLAREAVDAIGTLPSPLGERAGAFASLYSEPRQQALAARAAVDAFNQASARGQGFADLSQQGSAWDRSMSPVMASARQGLPLETMAQDAGFGGNVSGFLAGRMLDHRPPTLDMPSQAVPWHPQMAPHDWEMGAAVSNALGHRISQGAAARVYHEIRSPETGGGWNAGAQFVQNVQEIFQRPPTDPIAALEGRLNEMEARGAVSPRAMTLWRANAKSKS